MKRISLVAVLLLLASSAFAQYAAVGKVANSFHDLSTTSSSGGVTTNSVEICGFCHVPHQSPSTPTTTPQTPLWNHTLGATITGTYGTTSSTFTALSTDIAALGAPTWGSATTSHLCLSCHDGTVGVNSTYALIGPGGTKPTITGGTTLLTSAAAGTLATSNPANLGTNLSGSHPVNFTYSGAAWLTKQTHVAIPTGNVVSSKNFPLDNNGKLQCTTCHEPHDNTTNTFFLRDTISGSALCLDCHLAT